MGAAYAAGVFDANGKIEILPGANILWVQIFGEKEWLSRVLKGYRGIGGDPPYAALSGHQARDFLAAIEPYVVRKRAEVENALRQWAIRKAAEAEFAQTVQASLAAR